MNMNSCTHTASADIDKLRVIESRRKEAPVKSVDSEDGSQSTRPAYTLIHAKFWIQEKKKKKIFIFIGHI